MGKGTWHARLPLPLSVAALLIAALSVTPVGDAATALFASNAGSVDGLSATRTPKAGQLLALDRNAQFPAKALPRVTGAAGPRGAQGPRGAAGDPGASGDVVFQTSGSQDYSTVPGEYVVMASVKDLPPANWFVFGTGWTGSTGSGPVEYTCALLDGDKVVASSTVTAGRSAVAGMRFSPQLAIAGISRPPSAKIDWSCAPHGTLLASLQQIGLVAIRVGSIEEREWTG